MTIPYYKDFADAVKCGGCGFRVHRKYSFSEDIRAHGLCGLCFMEMIIDEEMEIFPKGVTAAIDKLPS